MIYVAFNNTLLIIVCKAPFHYPTNGLNRSRYSNRALGKLAKMCIQILLCRLEGIPYTIVSTSHPVPPSLFIS